MWLVFIDECSDTKFKDYLGLSLVIMNARFYAQIKREVHLLLIDNGWDPWVEFKGEFLFSATKGCTAVDVERRVELVEELIALQAAEKNLRLKFYYAQMESKNPKADYLAIAPSLLDKALPRAAKGGGKDLLSIVCDHRTDISSGELHYELEPIATGKGYILHEQVVSSPSTFETVGLMYADIIGYLTARIDTISNDSEFLQNIPPEYFETNGKLRKLRTSQKLMENVKKLQRYRVYPK